MTVPTVTAAPPTLPLPPATATRPGYRDRVRARYTAAAEERIDRGRNAAAELGCSNSVPWDDIRAVYIRPLRSPWKSFTTVIGSIVSGAIVAAVVIGYVGIVLVAALLYFSKENRAEAAKTTPTAQEAAAVAATDDGFTRQDKKQLEFFGVGVVCAVFVAASLRGSRDRRELAGRTAYRWPVCPCSRHHALARP
ncbi:hypothetical protein ABZY44_08705 [Streptomyces sp. NPDC006544]|uniref:hypothetical protein n=1 Tax=Streptomyces sp. NPDC006544 TaxID=3154583 RepID=UPI0033A6256C